MKKLTKILSLMLALTMLLSFPVAVSAAELEDAPIDESKTGSLTIYKYDLTKSSHYHLPHAYLRRASALAHWYLTCNQGGSSKV